MLRLSYFRASLPPRAAVRPSSPLPAPPARSSATACPTEPSTGSRRPGSRAATHARRQEVSGPPAGRRGSAGQPRALAPRPRSRHGECQPLHARRQTRGTFKYHKHRLP